MKPSKYLQPIIDRLRARGINELDASAMAEAAAARNRDRMLAIDGQAQRKLEERLEAAQQALAEEAERQDARRAIFDEIETRIDALGQHREMLRTFEREFIRGDVDSLAEKAFRAWEGTQTDFCPKTTSAFHVAVDDLIRSTVMGERAESHLQDLRTREKEMIDQIHSVCKREKVDLGKLVAQMRVEAAEPIGPSVRNPQRHTWFESGLLALN